MKVSWSRSALDDLKEIRRYIAQHDPRAAANVAAAIRRMRDLLRRHPMAGHEGREVGTRELVAGTHIVVRQVLPEVVQSLTVVDARRDRG